MDLEINMARNEAQSLFGLVARGTSVESLRELIGVPESTRSALLHFAALDPADTSWVENTLRFRDVVAQEFESLVEKSLLTPPVGAPGPACLALESALSTQATSYEQQHATY